VKECYKQNKTKRQGKERDRENEKEKGEKPERIN
jgi:hypothetical protein